MNLANIKATMTSREIAEVTGKPHYDLMKAIRAMEPTWEKVHKGKFSLMFSIRRLPNGGEVKDPYYELNKMECLYIATKFNDEARARLIIRWEELEREKQHAIPQNFSEALRLAAQQAEELEKKAMLLEKQKPKVLFADAVAASKTSILIGELAKVLKQNGIDIGQNRLFEWLRNNGYLISRNGTDYNMPTQKSMNLGLFEIKETTITHADGHISINKTTKVRGKGQTYFINKFLRNRPVQQEADFSDN